MQGVIQKLKEEGEKQTQHVAMVLARLKHEKDSWFVSSKSHSMCHCALRGILSLCQVIRNIQSIV